MTLAATLLALIAGGTLASASFADEDTSRPVLKPPEGYEVVDVGGSTPSPRIVGGTPASTDEARRMVQLFFYDQSDELYYFTCGGTMVTPTKVVTAAHCLYDGSQRLNWDAYGGVLAGTEKLAGGPNNTEGQFIDVRRSWVHENYNPETFTNDIAVLTLAKPVSGVVTVEMADGDDEALYAAGTEATAYGWGMTNSSDIRSLASTLQRVTLPIVDNAECATNFDANLPQDPGTFKPESMLCTGPLGTGDDTTGRSTCPGDSGGPLLVGGKLTGVVSWGLANQTQKCNISGTYEAFSRVKAFASKVKPRVDDTDISGNGRADFFLRGASTGKGYIKRSLGTSFTAHEGYSGSWSTYNLVLQSDLNRDGHQDFIMRRKSDGDIIWRHRTVSSSSWIDTKIRDSWGDRKFIVAAGDVTGDRFADLVSMTSDGTMYIYKSDGRGNMTSRVLAGTGFTGYNAMLGKGDYNGDGWNDLLARRASDGMLFLLPGTGDGKFGPRVQVAGWSTYNKLMAPGDVNRDGKADVIARRSDGALFLYLGTGRGDSGMFAARISLGTNFNRFDIMG